jgi:uracil-DNA glycosylase family 4
MAPGRVELAENRVLVGPTGNLLWSQLKDAANLDRSECYCVNVIGEWPEGAGGSPTTEQVERWWDRFNDAISVFQGQVVLLLGGDALRRFCGPIGGIEGWRGYVVTPKECLNLTRRVEVTGEYKTNTAKHRKGDPKITRRKQVEPPVLPPHVEIILPTLHPSAVVRTGFQTLPAFHADLKRVKRALSRDLGRSRTTFVEYPVVVTDTSSVAFDIETGGITGGIQRLGIANALETYTLLWDQRARSAALMELSRADRVKIAHNVGFDLPRLERAGVAIPDPLWDTMLAAQMAQPDLYKGLNSVASLYLDRKRWKHEAEGNPAYYNAQDASSTLELYQVLRLELERTKQLELFEGTIMPAIRTLVGMSQRGIKVHSARREQWIASLAGAHEAMLRAWQSQVGDVNPHSPLQVSRLLYDKLGLPRQFNKYGGSTTEESGLRQLLSLAPEEPRAVLQLLLNLRENQKLRSVYAEHPIGDDGCVHPSYLPGAKDVDQHGKGMAGTGRITAKEPNIQNQPEEARLLFIPRDDSLIMVEADFDAIEARIMAALSQDEELERAIQEGLHASNMRAFGVDKTRAKNGFYGWLYGAGERTLSKVFAGKGYTISIRDCRKLLDGFEARFNKVHQYRQQLISQVNTQFYLTNPFGRRRYFHGRNIPAALDFLPQSAASDIMWNILKPLDQAVSTQGGGLLATVHDSVLVECPRTKCGETVEAIREIMEREWPQISPGFKVPVKVKFGSSWGEMQEYDRS